MSKRKQENVNQPEAVVGQALSLTYRERKLKLSEDRMTVSCEKFFGYQTVLAEHSANAGQWCFSATIEELPEGSHVRIGWSTRRTRFDQPIGSDCFSFAIRDTDCARVCLARRWPVSDARELKAGDVVTCFLSLPSHAASPRHDDGLTYFPNLLCDPETAQDPDLAGPDTSISFAVNGRPLAEGFTNLVAGEYYPAVSLFGRAKVRFDFATDVDHFRAAKHMYVPKELMRPKRRPPNFIPRGLTSGA